MVNAISPQEAMLVSQELNEVQWDALIISVNKHLTKAWTITEARYGLFCG